MTDADTTVEMDQVIELVLQAELDADGGIADEAGADAARPDELDENDACGSLDGFSSDELAPQVEDDPAAAGNLVTVSQLDGVPLFFARGIAPRPQSFPIEPGFRDLLVRTVKTVRFRAPASFGDLVRITSAGAFVQKPGMHGLGRAFDHDAWRFEHVDIRPINHDHAASSLARRQRYWALGALIRSHSAFVLHGLYNDAHRDHFHQDNGGSHPFSTGSEATVKLVQAICKHIFGNTSVATDGDFGTKSKAAVADAMARLDLSGEISDSTQWKRFLLRSGRLGFELAAPQ